MLYSFRVKIIFFIFIILAFTAAFIMYFTYRDVGRAMIHAQQASAKNIHQFVEFGIKGDYEHLRYDKIKKTILLRKQLKAFSKIVSSVFSEYVKLSKNNTMLMPNPQKQALNWLRQFYDIEKSINCFVFKREGVIVSHPDTALQGSSISHLKDMKGRNLVDIAYTMKTDGDFAVFHCFSNTIKQGQACVNNLEKNSDVPLTKMIGYFLPFSDWDWVICTTLNISCIEAQFQTQLAEIVNVLEKHFASLKIADTGCAFLFNKKKELLTQPRLHKDNDFASAINALTGNNILDDFIKTSQKKINSIRYQLKSGKDHRLMEAHVKFFDLLEWYVAIIVPVEEIQLPGKRLVTRQIFLILAIFIVCLIITFFLVSRIIRPLNKLSLYAKEIPFHDFTSEDQDESSIQIYDLSIRYKGEIGRLAQSLVFMKNELTKNLRKLIETTASKERIQGELNIARKIQLGILPKIFPPFPDHHEFDLFATLEPAKEVGGDLYDFFFIDDDHICFALGDVSDKGVPAALFMVITKTLIKTLAQKKISPAETMIELNNILCSENPNDMFVTLFIGVLNIRTGEVRYSNGGHNPPIVVDKKEVYYKKGVSGLVVGAMEGIPYKEFSFTLEPGDSLFLYTDGVTEAKNMENKLFSDPRLLKEIKKIGHEPVEDVVRIIMERVEEYAESVPQSDDIAMMMFRYNGN